MSMLSNQVNGLRESAKWLKEAGISVGYNSTASTFVAHDAAERMEEAAHTIENLQKQLARNSIAELTVERDAYFEMVKRVQADCDSRDELIRDMARELRGLNDGGISTDCIKYEQRMRELGIEQEGEDE